MRKLQKVAVVAAMVGSVGFLGAGTAFAGGPDIDVKQAVDCDQFAPQVNVLSNVGLLNGVLGNVLSNESEAGEQSVENSPTQNCTPTAQF